MFPSPLETIIVLHLGDMQAGPGRKNLLVFMLPLSLFALVI
jgi:hypothetical protein